MLFPPLALGVAMDCDLLSLQSWAGVLVSCIWFVVFLFRLWIPRVEGVVHIEVHRLILRTLFFVAMRALLVNLAVAEVCRSVPVLARDGGGRRRTRLWFPQAPARVGYVSLPRAFRPTTRCARQTDRPSRRLRHLTSLPHCCPPLPGSAAWPCRPICTSNPGSIPADCIARRQPFSSPMIRVPTRRERQTTLTGPARRGIHELPDFRQRLRYYTCGWVDIYTPDLLAGSLLVVRSTDFVSKRASRPSNHITMRGPDGRGAAPLA
ncbi:hypothetical protein BO70DRAFT_218213 [Aspergillus heteromorphus CBS 117.55]|uniref:Uncharacterized protein n=1 Tax=Aspergillus heteromorphus CBS 117.55 TaxID=1448321 RepID=A0A317WI38_9EURO|nr:uncharacterized protein BO70DRAFT_218213 [Aspergillus heteromorphus CBS 117.55]PWY85959.1 hypothetical protein BO70DRAFT_218213 [Aspergillus heteromorphus CBS 117.55]